MCVAIADLTRIAESGDREAFGKLFDDMDSLLGDSAGGLRDLAAWIVEGTRGRGPA